MAITRSSASERGEIRRPGERRAPWRRKELIWMLAASLFAGAGIYMVYKAKTRALPEVEQALAQKRIANLNALSAREELIPLLDIFPEPSEREFAARKIYYVSGDLDNVGAIARVRATAEEVKRARGLKNFRERLGSAESIPLLTSEQLRYLKPSFVVRTPVTFRKAFWLWAGLFLAAFWAAHVWLSLRGSRAEQLLMPSTLALCAVGLILMAALRDPVRDTMLFVDFAQGTAGGAVLMAVASEIDFERIFGKLSFVPLLGSFALSAALIIFGSGPAGSDAKVNLLGFQPVEIVRLLLVFFLAGYFARRWDVLRHARETRTSLSAITRRIDIPPVEYTLPALLCVALALAFFFLQKDMGPALVFACLFLTLYGIARGSLFVPLAGLGLLAAGFGIGYLIGVPHTVRDRVAMWASPWDNLARGGDQLAHSLWSFATGGITGMGLGLGNPGLAPAAHTDLILSALGEECGFLGVAAVSALYVFIVYLAFRIALRAKSDYQFFLGAGLACATALQLIVIAGGTLGIFPLTGVVTPFLSYGRTALLANLFLAGVLLSISARSARTSEQPEMNERLKPFQGAVRAAVMIFAAVGIVVIAKAAYVQVANSAAVMGRGTLVIQADGARRFQYNPRFLEVMNEIPRGTIYDRNGLPIATDDWKLLDAHRAEYERLGVNLERACPKTDGRHYPFGAVMFDLLGDLRTRDRWAASNTAFVERDLARRLRGYDDRPTLVQLENPRTGKMETVVRYDYRELVPLLRHRYEPNHPEVRKILDRPRDVHMSIDSRLQLRVSEILRKQLQTVGKEKGAAVVMDPASGDLLAAVSYPLPPNGRPLEAPANPDQPAPMDRARYGLFPPGSTFKIVTAMAALRKNTALADKSYQCIRLPEGRVGNFLKGSSRPIRDDVQDKSPHGTVNMERGITVSCNAYFAQLGTYDVGADALWEMADHLGIATAVPNTAAQLRKSLPQSSYGQGQVTASPFQMARVAATVANDGLMPQGRWITDENNSRAAAPAAILDPASARKLGSFMREVVTSGTGRRAAASVPVAGKTGTAELENAPSHGWFIGFAPYGGSRQIAFSVLVENGVYGGAAAAPAGAEIVNAAASLGLIQQ